MSLATVRTVLVTLALAAAAVLAGATLAVTGGWYDISATAPHAQPVHGLLEMVVRQSVRRHASGIDEPVLDEPALVQRGAICFRDHCMGCHGAPGQAPADAALAMQPLPGPLQDATRHWRARELAWIVRNGIGMSGMPAWRGRMADADIWAVVGYLKWLPRASPAAHHLALAGLQHQDCPLPGEPPAPEPEVRLLIKAGREILPSPPRLAACRENRNACCPAAGPVANVVLVRRTNRRRIRGRQDPDVHS